MRVANTSQHKYVLDGAKLQEVGPTAKKGIWELTFQAA